MSHSLGEGVIPRDLRGHPLPGAALHLTCPGIPEEGLVLGLTDPLRAALPWDLHAPGVGAVRGGQPDILLAQRDAVEAPVRAVALDFAAGLENLPVPIDPAVHLAALLIVFNCKGQPGSPLGTE